METTESIITRVRDTIREGGIIAPGEWLEMAFSLNALIGEENDKYASLYVDVHGLQAMAIKDGASVSVGEVMMKSSKFYGDLLKQKGKINQIEEFIRIAKIRGSQADREYNLDA